MPVAVEAWDDGIKHHPTTPLRDLNMGPDFIRGRNAVDSKVERTGQRRLMIMDNHHPGTVESADPRRLKHRGKHKGPEQRRPPNDETGGGCGGQKFSNRKNSGNRSESDSDSVKLSVRERVQLLNRQTERKSDVNSRGRSKVTRGWMKKRDQSAPPQSDRNHVFQNQDSVSESISPSRRSRSIDRSRDRHADGNRNIETVSGRDHLDSPKSQEMKPSRNSAFAEVGGLGNFDGGKSTALSAFSAPIREPHFNPRSRMRDPRTVKTFSKSITVKRSSPPSGPLQKERGVNRASEGPLERVTTGLSEDQSMGVSVKRMVSFIHKGGLEDSRIAKPQMTRRKRKEATDSESLSVYSSSQAEAQPTTQMSDNNDPQSCSVASSVDSESFQTDDKPIANGGGCNDPKDKVSSDELGKASPMTSKANKQLLLTSQKTSSTAEVSGGLSLSGNITVTSTVLSTDRHPIEQTQVHLSNSEPPQSSLVNVRSNLGEAAPFSEGQRQVYNLHYKSDSSSSLCKSDNDSKRHISGISDPEWDDIVAKSYEVSLSSSTKPEVSRDVGTTSGTAAVQRHHRPELRESPSKGPPGGEEVDVFNKSMHPLDFALAIRDITEPENVMVRSSDRSFDGKDSPCDGIVFARRVHVREETDGRPPSQSVTSSDKREDQEEAAEDGADEVKGDDVFLPEKSEKAVIQDQDEKNIRGRDPGMPSAASTGVKTHRRLETYSSLTTVKMKSDSSGGGKVENVSPLLDVSVEVDVESEEEDYVRIKPTYRPSPDPATAEIKVLKGSGDRKLLHQEQKPFTSTSSYRPSTASPDDSLQKWAQRVGRRSNQSTPSHKPTVDSVEREIHATKVSLELNMHRKEQLPSSSGPSNIAKLKAKSQIDVQPSFSEAVKPKLSASPEARRHHRLKIGHRRMASKSSITSTGSVSYNQSSQGSSSNEARGQRRTRGRKSSVLSPTLSGRSSNPPPNDITVVDPHSSVDSVQTPRSSRSKVKYSRANSEVSSSSSQSRLNRFFDMMGLESAVLSSVLQPVLYNDDSMFQDMHTWRVGSSTNSSHSGSFSEGSRVSADGVMNMKKLTKLPDQSQSIITKNARVIKWLVQCKKLQSVGR